MSPAAIALLARLRQRAQAASTRVELADAWREFLVVSPTHAGDPEAGARLHALFIELQQAGVLVLPRGRGCWDRTSRPHLPRWVRVPSGQSAPPERVRHREVAWAPELAFVAALPRVDALDELLAIQRFLSQGGRDAPMVPVRERSAELFGHEKRLEDLAGSRTLFRPGRLSLELLRCHEVPLPMVWRPGPRAARGRPLLVVENHHTYESLCRWNGREAAWAGVVYGAGTAFERLVPDLARVMMEAAAAPLVEYFGDLDEVGLATPCTAAATARSLELPPIQPAERLYELLLDRGNALNVVNPDSSRAPETARQWLPQALRDRAASWLDRGLRLPQELVGWGVLLDRPRDAVRPGPAAIDSPWVEACELRNHLLQDPLLDWLQAWGAQHAFEQDTVDPRVDFPTFVAQKARAFEEAVLAELSRLAGLVRIPVAADRSTGPPSSCVEETIRAMRAGAPLIAHGVLVDGTSRTYARPTLIARSDLLARLFPGSVLDHEACLPAPELGAGPWHYRIVLVRFATLELTSKGEVVGELPALGEVFVANRALGDTQGLLPLDSYVLARSASRSGPGGMIVGRNALEGLGRIRQTTWLPEGRPLAEAVEQATEWVRRVRADGASWRALPEPTVVQLRPNMQNGQSGRWRGAKHRIASGQAELTTLWGVGPARRQRALDANVTRWDVPRCASDLLGLDGEQARVLDAILLANRSPSVGLHLGTGARAPEAAAIEFFVDFETVSDLDDDFSAFPARGGDPVTFMIGCGHVEAGEWRFSAFVADSLTSSAEAEIVRRWLQHLVETRARVSAGAQSVRVLHWSTAEPVNLTRAGVVSLDRPLGPDVDLRLEWVDLLGLARGAPFTVAGAFDLGLKSIATALQRQGLISTTWEQGPVDGLGAMAAAWWCASEAKRLGCSLALLDVMRDIERYNEVDCRAMQEILALVRARSAPALPGTRTSQATPPQ